MENMEALGGPGGGTAAMGGDVRDVYVTLCQGSLPLSHPPLSAPTCGVAVAW